MDNSASHMSCVLRLNMQTRGWEKSMHKLIKDIRDVTYTIDGVMGLAYVSGRMGPEIILRIRKCKKHVQLIHIKDGHSVIPRPPSYNLPTITGFNQPQPPTPMFQTEAEPYMHYCQIPYEQPQVALFLSEAFFDKIITGFSASLLRSNVEIRKMDSNGEKSCP